MAPCMDLDELKLFVNTAKPNSMVVYFTGAHLHDTTVSKIVGNFIYDEAVKGRVYLVRRRTLEYPSFFDYMAIKASRYPRVRLVPLPKDIVTDRYKTGADYGETIE